MSKFSLQSGELGAITHLSNGTRAVAGSNDNFLLLFDTTTGTVITQASNAHEKWVSKIEVSPDGTFIITCDNCSEVVKMWDPKDNLKELAELKGHDG